MASKDILAERLQRAAADPGLMPEFYRLLAESAVLVPVSRVPAADGRPEVRVVVGWRDPKDQVVFVPVFSGPARVPAGQPASVEIVSDSLRRLIEAMPQGHFRLNPAGPVALDLPPDTTAMLLKDGTIHAGAEASTIPQGANIAIGAPTEDPRALTAALRSHFDRQPAAPTIFIYDLHRPETHGSTHSLAVGVVSAYDVTIAHDIGAIVSEAYTGALPVDVCFLVADDEVVEALVGMAIAPVVTSRAATVPQ